MPCCEANIVCSCNHTIDPAYECCQPHLRDNFKNVTPAEIKDENCVINRLASGDCCHPPGQECFGPNHYLRHPTTVKESAAGRHLHCVPGSCPLGKVLCCTDCKNDKDIIKAEDISDTQEGIICREVCSQEPISESNAVMKKRLCCAKETPLTEPIICRCGPCCPSGNLKLCGCQCGAAVFSEPRKEKPKKTVRFADEGVKAEDFEKAFRNLDMEDAKHLCVCCRECAVIGKEHFVGKPVLVYEFPEQKLEDTSITQKDFCRKKMDIREVPPWHPNMMYRWRYLNVPSMCETTYQYDFKPPPVSYAEADAERKPVYLFPEREKKDPCQQMVEEYCSWRKTSTGERHTCHSLCDVCNADLHKVHLHECDVAHLPPEYQDHGDGHHCQPVFHTPGIKVALCERGGTGESPYWWQRTCCVHEKKEREKLADLPPDLMKPLCPAYTTSYKHDFKDPVRLQREKLYFENCTACDDCSRPQGEEQINLLCTKNTREPFTLQRAGIV